MLLLVVVAAAEFIVRGPLQIESGDDMSSPYVATKRFLAGADPYTPVHFVREWHDAGAPASQLPSEAALHPVYPPISLAVFIPFALLPWMSALWVNTILCVLLYAGLLYALGLEIGEGWSSPLRLGFVAYGLALSPFQAVVRHANVSGLSFVLCAIALLLARKDWQLTAGLLLAVGCCLKPTGGVPFAVVALCFGWRRAFAVCIAAGAAIAAGSLAWMQHVDPSWRTSYAANLTYAFSPVGALSFITRNNARFDDLNLQVPYYALVRDAGRANLLAYATAVILAVLWMVAAYRGRSLREGLPFDWATVGFWTMLSLLPFYQRNYNAAVILFALLWAFRHPARRAAWAIAALGLFFVVPGEALLRRMGLAERFGDHLAWNIVIMSQATWAALGIVLILLYVQWRERAEKLPAA